ncbi:hypothetical protein [Pseudoalteromonas phage J2-1_QLiu-2017]|nr:hypothetical protein [Pseudoalteromonas phage J2-1_QLiu-2017]
MAISIKGSILEAIGSQVLEQSNQANDFTVESETFIYVINGNEYEINKTLRKNSSSTLSSLAQALFPHIVCVSDLVRLALKIETTQEERNQGYLEYFSDIENFEGKANLCLSSGTWDDYTESEANELKDRYQSISDRLSDTVSSIEDKIEECPDWVNEHKAQLLIDKINARITELDEWIDDIDRADFEYNYDWYNAYVVPDHLLYRLKESGEMILDDRYWLRTCCGQSLYADNCVIVAAWDLAMSHMGFKID